MLFNVLSWKVGVILWLETTSWSVQSVFSCPFYWWCFNNVQLWFVRHLSSSLLTLFVASSIGHTFWGISLNSFRLVIMFGISFDHKWLNIYQKYKFEIWHVYVLNWGLHMWQFMQLTQMKQICLITIFDNMHKWPDLSKNISFQFY